MVGPLGISISTGPVLTNSTTNTVRRAAPADLPDIVRIHERAFCHFFLSLMGSEFLRRYYALVLKYQLGIVLVGESLGVINGFACGFLNPAEFYKLMRRCSHTFVFPTACAVAKHPSLLIGIARRVQRVREAASQAATHSCELSSIAVAPEAKRAGLGATLAQAFLSEAWAMNAKCVCLCTDANGNEAANAFYRKVGFRENRRFLQHPGRWMNEYIIGSLNGVDGSGNAI
jgi:ribosomal protein S18 acetylase RimI-like enzyme